MKRLWRTLVAGAGVLAASPARGIDRADRDWLLRGPDLEPAAEGVLTVSGTPTTTTRWIGGTKTVTVTDGRLTIRSGAGASNNKICFVEITQS